MDALLPGGLDGVLPGPDQPAAERDISSSVGGEGTGLPVRVQHEAGVALELREAPRVAVDLLRRRRRHALGLLLLSRGAAARARPRARGFWVPNVVRGIRPRAAPTRRPVIAICFTFMASRTKI